MKFNVNKYALQGAVATFFLGALFYGTYMCHTFPFTDGWGINYVMLMESGRFPYRDFYFYLPPLNLFVDGWLWDLAGHTFMGYRILRLIERLLFFQVYYWILVRYYKPSIACIACVAGTIFCGADLYDLMGDYTQTATFCVLAVAAAFLAFEKASSVLAKSLSIFAAGVFAGMAMMTKQTHGVAICIVFGSYFLVRSLVRRDENFCKYCIVGLGGFAIPVGGCLLWLYANDALGAFFEFCFGDTGAKGSLFDLLVLAPIGSLSTLSDGLREKHIMVLSLFALYFLLANRDSVTSSQVMAGLVFIFGACMLIPIWSGSFSRLAFMLSPMIFYLAWRCYRQEAGRGNDLLGLVPIGMTFFVLGIILRMDFVRIDRLAMKHEIVLTGVCTISYAAILILCVFLLVNKIVKRATNPAHVVVFTLGAIANCYALVMASRNTSLGAGRLFLPMPIVICLAMSVLPRKGLKARAFLTFGAIVLFSTVIYAKKLQQAYNWWGWCDADVHEKAFSAASPQLSGFRFSLDEKKIYDDVLKTIGENSSEEDQVLAFPHMPIYNILSGRKCDAFVPVLFFDVCSDRYASDSAQWLSGHPPKIVVWADLGQVCWNLHEDVFRDGGRLGQRDIQEWLYDAVKEGRYKLIGQTSHVFTYARIDSADEVFSCHIQNPDLENSTLTKKALRRKNLEGNDSLKRAAEWPRKDFSAKK